MLQTAAKVYKFVLPFRSNSDIQEPRSRFKSKDEGIKRANYKAALLKLSSSHWKIIVVYLQNTID